MSDYQTWLRDLAFACIVTLGVGIAACYSGALAIDGRSSAWTAAANCSHVPDQPNCSGTAPNRK